MILRRIISKMALIFLSNNEIPLHAPISKGNAGGYLGLFLGYAILHIPDLLRDASIWIMRRWGKKNGPRPKTNKIIVKTKRTV